MIRDVEYLDAARTDFDASFDWYKNRSAIAAIGFALAVDEAISKIVAEPHRFPSTLGECRYCSLRRYPFRIVFRDEPGRVVVVAVAHAKRRPGFWHDRVGA
jgi:plasmid stabilization system protein ParE